MNRLLRLAAATALTLGLAASGAFAQSKGTIYYLVPTLLAGKKVETTNSKAFGCGIQNK